MTVKFRLLIKELIPQKFVKLLLFCIIKDLTEERLFSASRFVKAGLRPIIKYSPTLVKLLSPSIFVSALFELK